MRLSYTPLAMARRKRKQLCGWESWKKDLEDDLAFVDWPVLDQVFFLTNL
jgi:hypothetical protein